MSQVRELVPVRMIEDGSQNSRLHRVIRSNDDVMFASWKMPFEVAISTDHWSLSEICAIR